MQAVLSERRRTIGHGRRRVEEPPVGGLVFGDLDP